VNARLSRKPNGVLEVALHTDGGKLLFNGHTHEQFVHLFHAIGEDHHNRVVILTGSGDAFMDAIGPEGFDFFSPQGYDKILREGRKVSLEHPRHRITDDRRLERAGTAALRICTADRHHPGDARDGVPGQAAFRLRHRAGRRVNLLWPEVIGSIRGRYFILTRQVLDAQTAKAWGVVNEVVPADRLLARAHEIADTIAALPPLTSRYTRIALTQKLRRIIDEGSGYSLALEGISAADVARAAAQNKRARSA